MDYFSQFLSLPELVPIQCITCEWPSIHSCNWVVNLPCQQEKRDGMASFCDYCRLLQVTRALLFAGYTSKESWIKSMMFTKCQLQCMEPSKKKQRARFSNVYNSVAQPTWAVEASSRTTLWLYKWKQIARKLIGNPTFCSLFLVHWLGNNSFYPWSHAPTYQFYILWPLFWVLLYIFLVLFHLVWLCC